MIILAILFLVTAIVYSSVGFGGGSTYLALLLIWEVPYFIFPIIALSCNIIVVSGNCFNYIKARNLNFKTLIPYLLGSIPMAFLGGSLSLEKAFFEILLFFVLFSAGLLLLFNFKSYNEDNLYYRKISIVSSSLIGGTIGFISGIVGIGGGIFLSPILFLIRGEKPKNIITMSSIFILINSISGLFGQLTKSLIFEQLQNYWYLLAIVFVGGQIGNFLNLKLLPTQILALITSFLVIFVAARMGYNIFF